jgi:hypothetical protein
MTEPERPARCAPATRAATPSRSRAPPAIAKQEFTRLAQCLDVKPREAPKSLLLRDLCALCASALNPCFLAGLPAEPKRELAARAPRLRVRANPPPPRPASPNPAAPFKPSRTDPLNREPPVASESLRIEPAAHEPTVRFESSRIDPLNREPTAKPGSTAPFKPFRTDPLNREPGAFPDPGPQTVHRIHEPAHIRVSKRCAAHAETAPQARKSLPQMNADERR